MRLGLRVHVLERRTPEELQDQGGGLRLGKDVEDFLASLDSEDELTYLIRHRRLVVFGKDGEEIETKDINVPSTSWGCLHRTLRKTFDQLAPSTHSTFAEAAFVGDVHEDSNGTLVIEYEHHGSTQTMSADLIVGADGAASRVRQLFAPESENNYTGYVVWRGLVSYSSLKGDVSDAMIYNRTWHFGDDYMVVGYSVPGQDDDSLDAREDQVNWAWFLNTPEERLREVMTDVNGKQHSFTVSAGNVSPKVIQEMHESARLELPKDLSTVVRKARLPFVQVITDIFTRQNTFLSGKVVLIGDAVGAMRYVIPTALLGALLTYQDPILALGQDKQSSTPDY